MTAGPEDPYPVLRQWLADAPGSGAHEPYAAVLATVGDDGRPSTRAVMIAHTDDRGLLFSTFTGSRKGRQLAARPWASATYVWPERQLTVSGPVELLPEAEADRVFALRPREFRAATAVSAQSRPLDDPERLRAAAAELRGGEAAIARPEEWRCYRLVPYGVEFWQQAADRVHLSVRYAREAEGAAWHRQLLQP
ncbi:pyridoxal 5'-phosphate synthase [Streptomyces sp. NPDC051940]|uniref:pyridoxine/pyridoxamine 5'-phosphate oxidase n=1 Tax=Streptomyces sp. NPDC051940 TaxID=3155675 RepID=UPI003434063E